MGRYEFDKVDSLTLADSIHQSLTSDELNSLIDGIILDDSELQACIEKQMREYTQKVIRAALGRFISALKTKRRPRGAVSIMLNKTWATL